VQRQRLAQEQSQLQPEGLRAQAETARGVAERLQAELQALEAEFAQLDQHIHQAREQRQAIESQLHPQRSQLQQQQGALASLKTLQQAALRQDDSQAWLQQQGLAGLPKLIDLIHVQAGWESHVEQALGAALTAPVLPAGQPFPPQGPEVGLMLFQQDAENAVPVIYPDDSLASKVSGNQAVRAWLASQPLMMDGSQRGAGWVRYASRRQPTQGALGRVGQIQTLESQIATLKTDIQQAESHIQTLRQQQSQWEGLRQPKRLESLRQPLQAALMQQQSATLRAQQAESRLQQIMQEQQGLTDTSEAEILSQQQKVAELHALVQSQQSALLAAQSQLQQARQHGQASRSAWQQRQQALQRAEVQAAQVQATLSALEASLQQQDQQLLAVSEQIAQARHAVALAEAPCLQAEQALIEAEQQLAQQRDFMRDVRLQAESNDAAQASAWAAFRQAEEDERLQTLRMQQAAVNQASSEGRLHSQQEGLEAALLEAEIAIDAVIEADPEALEQQLGQVKRRLERLGAINLVAAQEASEQQERLQYLEAQHADVSAALASLETSMQQIDGETSALFDTTFDKVNGVFSARFPQLFGGGEAYLERIQHTGVKVVARPPGKRNASVHLLSGGEKAMTAVSLLLALFQLNPAPFCLLDEVDAPLDDANVMRFCDVVKEMSDNVQFLIITHNRLTMELAQQLHGVTMQEPGVSRLVSVDVQQAVASLQSSPASSSNEGT
jgi:chromosome segregation protein